MKSDTRRQGINRIQGICHYYIQRKEYKHNRTLQNSYSSFYYSQQSLKEAKVLYLSSRMSSKCYPSKLNTFIFRVSFAYTFSSICKNPTQQVPLCPRNFLSDR